VLRHADGRDGDARGARQTRQRAAVIGGATPGVGDSACYCHGQAAIETELYTNTGITEKIYNL